MINTLSISDARKNIFKITDRIAKLGGHYVLTEKGRAKAVVLSVAEFESWQETLESLRDFPDLKNDLTQAARDRKKGKDRHYVTLESLLAKEGYTYVPSKTRSKSRKRIAKAF